MKRHTDFDRAARLKAEVLAEAGVQPVSQAEAIKARLAQLRAMRTVDILAEELRWDRADV